MSVKELRQEMIEDLLHEGWTPGASVKLVDRLIQAVRAEAEERVWAIFERVLSRKDEWIYIDHNGTHWSVDKLKGNALVEVGKGITAREAILAAAKELGIEED